MSNTTALTQNLLGGLGPSYSSVDDLQMLSLPKDGKFALIIGNVVQTPINISAKTLKITLTVNNLTQPEVTITFPSNYATLDLAVTAFNSLATGIVAENNAGRFLIRGAKKGKDQSISLSQSGTANTLLGFSDVVPLYGSGTSTISNEFDDDEKVYALLAAYSICNGYLQRRYTLPLLSWQTDLKQAQCDIAADILMSRRGYNPETQTYDNNFRLKKEQSLTWLDATGNRKLHPVITDSGIKLSPTAEVPVSDAVVFSKMFQLLNGVIA